MPAVRERECISCGQAFQPPRIDDTFTRVDPERCIECTKARRLNAPLVIPLVDHHNTGTLHAVTNKPYNEDGVKTACGRIVEAVPRTGSHHDIECDMCETIVFTYDVVQEAMSRGRASHEEANP